MQGQKRQQAGCTVGNLFLRTDISQQNAHDLLMVIEIDCES